MKPPTHKLTPRPSEIAEKQRARAIAAERIPRSHAVLLDGLTGSTRETVRRLAILALSEQARIETGVGHALGNLCRAVTDMSPAHRPVDRRETAERALTKFSPKYEGEA